MAIFLYIIEILSGTLLIALVLMHSPKGEGLAAIGSASQLFSSQKSVEKGLNKVTYIVSGVFIAVAFILGFLIK